MSCASRVAGETAVRLVAAIGTKTMTSAERGFLVNTIFVGSWLVGPFVSVSIIPRDQRLRPDLGLSGRNSMPPDPKQNFRDTADAQSNGAKAPSTLNVLPGR